MFFNIANNITIFRIVISIPTIIILFYINSISNLLNIDITWMRIIVSILFTFTMFTDIYDGMLARKLNLITTVGKVLDPVADKFLIIGVLLVFLKQDEVSLLTVFIIIIRDFIVMIFRMIMIEKKINIAASKLAKIKTLVQSIALAVMILKLEIGLYILWISVLLSIYTMINYIKILVKESK